MSDMSMGDETVAVRAGRRSPYTNVPDWLLLHPEVSAQGFRLYVALLAHLNNARADGICWPSRESLGRILGVGADQIKRLLKTLTAAGAVEPFARHADNGAQLSNGYTVHETPPPDFSGAVSIAAWYQQDREDPRSGGGTQGKPRGGMTDVTPPGKPERPPEQDEVKQDEEEQNPPSPPEAASVSVVAREPATKPAAEPADWSGPVKPGMQWSERLNEQTDQVLMAYDDTDPNNGGLDFVKFYNQTGVKRLAYGRLRMVVAGLLTARDGSDRTVAQLCERIRRRAAYRAAEGFGPPADMMAVALSLVSALGMCGNPRCEDSVDVDTGAACQQCEQRLSDQERERGPEGGPVPD